MFFRKELTENYKRMIGLRKLGIPATDDGEKVTSHTDKPPDDKVIMAAYDEWVIEQEASKNAPTLEEKFERLQTKLVEKAVITEAEKETISSLSLTAKAQNKGK